MNRFKLWESFKYKGRKFLALTENNDAGHVHIKGEAFANYGSYLSIESFKDMYAKQGETLNLTAAEASFQANLKAEADAREDELKGVGGEGWGTSKWISTTIRPKKSVRWTTVIRM